MTDEQWVTDNEQPHDEDWELSIDILRVMHERDLDIQAMVDVIKQVEKQNFFMLDKYITPPNHGKNCDNCPLSAAGGCFTCGTADRKEDLK